MFITNVLKVLQLAELLPETFRKCSLIYLKNSIRRDLEKVNKKYFITKKPKKNCFFLLSFFVNFF